MRSLRLWSWSLAVARTLSFADGVSFSSQERIGYISMWVGTCLYLPCILIELAIPAGERARARCPHPKLLVPVPSIIMRKLDIADGPERRVPYVARSGSKPTSHPKEPVPEDPATPPRIGAIKEELNKMAASFLSKVQNPCIPDDQSRPSDLGTPTAATWQQTLAAVAGGSAGPPASGGTPSSSANDFDLIRLQRQWNSHLGSWTGRLIQCVPGIKCVPGIDDPDAPDMYWTRATAGPRARMCSEETISINTLSKLYTDGYLPADLMVCAEVGPRQDEWRYVGNLMDELGVPRPTKRAIVDVPKPRSRPNLWSSSDDELTKMRHHPPAHAPRATQSNYHALPKRKVPTPQREHHRTPK